MEVSGAFRYRINAGSLLGRVRYGDSRGPVETGHSETAGSGHSALRGAPAGAAADHPAHADPAAEGVGDGRPGDPDRPPGGTTTCRVHADGYRPQPGLHHRGTGQVGPLVPGDGPAPVIASNPL